MQRFYSDESTLTLTYSNLCLFLRHLGRPDLTEDEVNDFIELEIEAGNIKAKKTRLMEDSIYLKPVKCLPLSPRSFKCLVRALPDTSRPDEERTIGEVMRRIPHISGIRNCGYTTAKEIYDVFKAAGINVDHWAAEIKLPYVKAQDKINAPFPNLNKTPQPETRFESYPNKYRYDRKHDDDFDVMDDLDSLDDIDTMDDLDNYSKDAEYYTTGVLYKKGKNVIIKLSNEGKRKK